MASTFASSLLCLSIVGSAVRSIDAETAATGNRRFLAKAPSEGQQCGTSGSDGHFYGDCSAGLACVAAAAGSPLGTPSTCHKVCGSFGADGDSTNGTCGAGQTCSGKAATPCREWAGECYMYCSDVNLFKQGEGQQCGTSGSDGHFYGNCSEGLECVAPATGSPLGTPSTCQKAGQPQGQQCGSSGSSGYFFGHCSGGLACVPPAAGSPPGTPSICHEVCGSFGAGGDHINVTCGTGQTCSGKAATPCREWAGECYMYCFESVGSL